MSFWSNRIVGSGTANPADIMLNPANVRIHPPEQIEALHAILRSVGWVDEVIINKTTGHLLDGHARVEVALLHGETAIPVSYVEMDLPEELVVLGTFDRIGSLATIDAGNLGSLLHATTSDDPLVAQMLADFAEDAGVVNLSEFEDPDALDAAIADGASASAPVEEADTTARIGEYTFPIERGVFLAWQEEIRQSAGFDTPSITAEILRRLGLDASPAA